MQRSCLFVLGALLALSPAVCLEPGRPSKTSIWVAAFRAIGSHDYDPAVRNPDWLAERFLGPEERAQLGDHPVIKGLQADYREASKLPGVRNMAVRTHFIDGQMKSAVQRGIKQVVILGAGFDSRAYRYRELLRGTRAFEVDYGPTQEFKKRRVLDVLGAVPSNLIYAPIDFTKEKLPDVLRAAGYRREEKAFFIWEGVTMYISREAVQGTMRWIASTAPGSSVVLDMISTAWLEDPRIRPAREMVAGWGEPWIFSIPNGEEAAFVRATGLEPAEIVDMNHPDTVKQFITRRDGTYLGQIPDTPLALFSPYWLVHATVAERR